MKQRIQKVFNRMTTEDVMKIKFNEKCHLKKKNKKRTLNIPEVVFIIIFFVCYCCLMLNETQLLFVHHIQIAVQKSVLY